VCLASAVKFILGRPAIPSRPGSRSTNTTSIWRNQTNLLWLNVSTCATDLNSWTPLSSPPSLDPWTRWLGRQSRLSYTWITWTGRMAFISANHGRPSSTLSKDVGSISCSTASPHLATRPYYPFKDIIQLKPVPCFFFLISGYFFPYISFHVLLHVHPHSCTSTDPKSSPSGALIRAVPFTLSLSLAILSLLDRLQHSPPSPTGSVALTWFWPPSPWVWPKKLCLNWLVPLIDFLHAACSSP
jgi:hypothetical protein